MDGRRRTGEIYALVKAPAVGVQVFLVLASTLVNSETILGGYRHDILILDPGDAGVLAGHRDVIYENAYCTIFSIHYKRVGSDLPETV
jgi:hypothetical protein